MRWLGLSSATSTRRPLFALNGGHASTEERIF